MTKTPLAVLALLAAASAPTVASAQDDGGGNHGYGGVGLALVSSSTSSASLGDTNWTGGGLGFTGAGVFDLGAVGIGVTGAMQFGGRTEQDTDVEVTDAMVAFDGGIIVVKMLYLSLGVHTIATTFDADDTGVGTDVTYSNTVIPLGIGFINADDKGYFLGQIRFGGGTATEDYFDSEEDIGYFGIRLAGQMGMENGVQFMGAMELDAYDHKDTDLTESFFRLILGVAFGT